jgi:Flp pilus assembly protein TadD
VRSWAGRRLRANALIEQGRQHERAKRHQQAIELYRKAVAAEATCAEAHDVLAWLLVTGAAAVRNPREGLVYARRAVELYPEQYAYENTLGVALYRNGQYAEAVPVLERSLELSQDRNDAYSSFFLAMCHHRLGHEAAARNWHEKALDWFERHRATLDPSWVAELTAFQNEAEGN